MTDITAVAAALNTYHQSVDGILCAEAIDRWFADELDCRHEPADPTDGMIKSAWLVPGKAIESEIWAKTGLSMRPARDVTVDGDVITAETITTGPKGEVVSTTDYVVEDGRVVAMIIKGHAFEVVPQETLLELAEDFERMGAEMARIRSGS